MTTYIAYGDEVLIIVEREHNIIGSSEMIFGSPKLKAKYPPMHVVPV